MVEMVYVYETLTLIILARYITCHLKPESCSVEVVSEAISSSLRNIDFSWLIAWENCRCIL